MKKALPILVAISASLGCSLEKAPVGAVCPPIGAYGNAKAYVYINGTATEIETALCPDDATQCQKYTSKGDHPNHYFCRMPCDGKTLLCDGDCVKISDASGECRALYPNIKDDGSQIDLICTPNDTKCQNGKLSTCLGTAWSSETPCSSGQCNDDKKTCKLESNQICSPNQQKCDDTATSVTICASDGQTLTEIPCTNGRCSMAEGKVECLFSTVCEAGKKQCDASYMSVTTCNDAGTAISTQPCTPDKPVCEIVNNEAGCVTETLDTHCISGHSICDAQKTSSIPCQSNGTWGTPIACTADEICDTDSGLCVPKGGVISESCSNGEKKCDGNILLTCGMGAWKGTPCEGNTPVCDPIQLECVAGSTKPTCTPNVDYCTGTGRSAAMYHCTAEGQQGERIRWCGAAGCNEAWTSCVYDCTPGAADFCTIVDGAAGVYQCTDEGKQGALVKACDNGCNEDNTACDESCTPKTYKCTDTHTGTWYCDERGIWTIGGICFTGETCLDSLGKCAECEPGTIKCSEDHKGTVWCNEEGKWSSETKACLNNNTCFDGYNRCMLCEPGSSICMGSGKDAAMRRCADDGLSLLKPEQGDWCISSACTPDHTACAPVCTNGERKCDGVTIMVCENENWVESDSCDRSHVCNDEVGSICIPIRKTSGVGVCKEGETFCIDNRVMVCNNGLYEEQTACNNATESCITAYNTESNTYAAECSKTCVEKYCVENSLYYCVNGSAVGSSCKSADRCMLSPAQGKTGLEATCATKVCDEGTFSCAKSGKPELSILTICHNNAWIPLADCSEYNLSCSANGKIGKCI